MAIVTVNITRSSIFAIAEGISVKISQHNGGTPTFEQLWASQSESRKLDIYYREAAGDLEERLMDWAQATHAQFSLTADGNDYTLTLNLSPHWPSRLEGLLKNKIQDFFVHAVTAGWINDFDGLTVTDDYKAMGASDLKAAGDIIRKREFDFETSQRADNPDEKGDGSSVSAAGRHDNTEKDQFVLPYEAGSRRKDDVRKERSGQDGRPKLTRTCTDRHTDNDTVVIRHDWTDMSGTGMAYMDRPCRPVKRTDMGMGFTPSPTERRDMCKTDWSKPCRPDAWPDCRYCDRCRPAPEPTLPPPFDKNHPAYPHHPERPLPPYHANGIGWSDDERPDNRQEEEFVKNHLCGHHTCGHHGKDRLDWDFDDAQQQEHDESTFIEYDQ